MTCTEEYREHIEYTFHAFCKIVIRNATINAARTRSRKHKREISLEYLTDEKHYPLGTTDEYFQAPEPDEEYVLPFAAIPSLQDIPEKVQDSEAVKEPEKAEVLEIGGTADSEQSEEEKPSVFEYNGFHFEAAGELPKNAGIQEIARNTVSKNELGMSDYEDERLPYSHDGFYEASTAKTADVFRCIETGKNYLPGEHELFEYVGEFVPYLQKETSISEPEESISEELKTEEPTAGKAEESRTEETRPEKAATEQDEPESTEPKSLQEEMEPKEETLIENRLFLAMEEADVYLDDFSLEQVDVVYEAAEKGLNLVPMLNPEEINRIRRDRLLPLEPVAVDGMDGSGQTENLPPSSGKQAGRKVVANTSTQRADGQERINFHITDDDLGAGGPKQKFRANMNAILLLKELEDENRFATLEEQETLSRFVGWDGIPAAFDDKNKAWAAEYAELKQALTPEEYREARASTLNAFYTSPTVIKAMYEALGNMGLQQGNVLDIKMRYLIQTLYTENWKKGRNKGFQYNEVYESPYLISGKSKTLNAGRIYLNPPHVGLNPF